MTRISQLSFKIPWDTFPALEQKLLLNKNKGDSKKKKIYKLEIFLDFTDVKALVCVYGDVCVYEDYRVFYVEK